MAAIASFVNSASIWSPVAAPKSADHEGAGGITKRRQHCTHTVFGPVYPGSTIFPCLHRSQISVSRGELFPQDALHILQEWTPDFFPNGHLQLLHCFRSVSF